MRTLLHYLLWPFDRFDRWLCIYLRPYRLRHWYQRLWIRKDEFHPSVALDIEVLSALEPGEHRWYHADLYRRRNIAHRRDLGEVI